MAIFISRAIMSWNILGKFVKVRVIFLSIWGQSLENAEGFRGYLCRRVEKQHPLPADAEHAWRRTASLAHLLSQENVGAKDRQGGENLWKTTERCHHHDHHQSCDGRRSLTDEFGFGFLRTEGMHGSNLPHTEGVDLFNATSDVVLRGQVLSYLAPEKKYKGRIHQSVRKKKADNLHAFMSQKQWWFWLTLKACAAAPETDAAEQRAQRPVGLMKSLQASTGRSDTQTKATKTHTESQLEHIWTVLHCWETTTSPAGSGSPHRGHCWKTEDDSTSLSSGTRGQSRRLTGRPTDTAEAGGAGPSHLTQEKGSSYRFHAAQALARASITAYVLLSRECENVEPFRWVWELSLACFPFSRNVLSQKWKG